MISRASECEWTVGAPQGASLCTRIKRKPRGSNEWLRARTKRGAGSARRAGIQILSSEMTPLSAGYIAGGSNRPNWEFGELAPEKSSDRRIRDLTHTMASPRCFRIALILLLTCHVGIFCRAVPSRVLSPRMAQPVGQTSRADTLTRWKRGSADTQQERCAELAAPWRENIVPAPEDDGTLLQFRVRPFPPRGPQGLLFPGKSLFSFVRRVYRCCQERLNCRSVKGIPGRLRGGEWAQFQHAAQLTDDVRTRTGAT